MINTNNTTNTNTNTNIQPAIDDIASGTRYTLHHSAWARGYISRRGHGEIAPYTGRFGIGYTVRVPCWDSTMYHRVYYYIDTQADN